MAVPEKVVEMSASLLGQAALNSKAVRQSWNCNLNGTSNQTRQAFQEALESTTTQANSRYLMQK